MNRKVHDQESRKPSTKKDKQHDNKVKTYKQGKKSKTQNEEEDNMSEVSETYSFLNSEQDEDEDTWIGSMEDDDTLSPKLEQEENVMSDFISDVKVGIQTMEIGGLCCMQRPSAVELSSPRIEHHASFTSENQ